MITLLNDLTRKLQSIKNEIAQEEDKFKIVSLNLEKTSLEEELDFYVELIFENNEGKNFLNLASGDISMDKIKEAENKASLANISILNLIVKQGYNLKEEAENQLNSLLQNNPNIEDETYKETNEYKQAKILRKNIAGYDDFISKNRKRIKNFYSFLEQEDKIKLAKKVLDNYPLPQDKQQILVDEVNDFKSSINLYCKCKYPLSNKFNALTKNKDDSLAMYLLENEENIKRLTVISEHDVINRHFSKNVLVIEGIITSNRYVEFSKYAKEKNVADIVNNSGQFDSGKICFNEKDYRRFEGCIKELQTTDKTKSNMKELLKELDSLNILDDTVLVSESAGKEYGFAKFLRARKNFVDVFSKENVSEQEIKDSLENLKTEENKIRRIYSLIEEKLGDDFSSMPCNVDSFRNVLVPPSFKDNLCINAKFNSLFIMLSFIKEQGLTIDEFVDNPVASSSRCLQNHYQKNNIDSLLKGKSKSEALLFLSDTRKIPPLIDPIKYTRSYELLEKSETVAEYKRDNDLSTTAIRSKNGNINRALGMGMDYFSGRTSETIQNIFMAKKDSEGKIPYMDCYVSTKSLQDDVLTGLVFDEKSTLVEKIAQDGDIVKTFYEAIDIFKNFMLTRKDARKNNNFSLESKEVFHALQEFAAKITLTCGLLDASTYQKKGFTQEFVNDVFNVITDYRSVGALSDLNMNVDPVRVAYICGVINNSKKSLKTLEKDMTNTQKTKEDLFISEFERINKEIDDLDARADKISSKLEKGATNKEIEEIALEQQRKFIELRRLQNSRLDELKDDVSKGKITKYYFEKRAEQVKLLDNIKERPSMFRVDDKDYKNFNNYAKEVLKINTKELSSAELRIKKEQYNIVVKQLQEEKRLLLVNGLLAKNVLSSNKSINFNKVENIKIDDHIEEMKNVSEELLEEKNKRVQIQIDLNEESYIEENPLIEDKGMQFVPEKSDDLKF